MYRVGSVARHQGTFSRYRVHPANRPRFAGFGHPSHQPGAYSYFQKPYEVEQLLVAIQRAGEKRAVQKALRESEERFRGLYENATIGIYRTTPAGDILLANPALVRMIGYDSFEKGKSQSRRGCLRTRLSTRAVSKRRSNRRVKCAASNPVEAQGRFDCVCSRERQSRSRSARRNPLLRCSVEDITEKKIAEEALHESEERFRVIFEMQMMPSTSITRR